MKLIKNIYYGKVQDEARMLDLYLPDAESFPVFVYFHGGGLVNGSKDNGAYYEQLANRGIAVATCNYRMYPAAKYPDFILDAAEAVAWVKNHISEYGICDKIFVGGSSAGGYLSMMLCFDPLWLSANRVKLSDIAGFIHDAGQPTVHFNVLKERGIDSRRVIIDTAAPLFHIGNGAKYPPMLIIVSYNDMKNRYEQTMLLMSTLDHFGYSDLATLKLMHGTHCAYGKLFEEDGSNVFANLIEEYIKDHI
jgi:hypothetical protein